MENRNRKGKNIRITQIKNRHWLSFLMRYLKLSHSENKHLNKTWRRELTMLRLEERTYRLVEERMSQAQKKTV